MKKYRLIFEGDEQDEVFDSYEDAMDHAIDLIDAFGDRCIELGDMPADDLDLAEFDCEIEEEG